MISSWAIRAQKCDYALGWLNALSYVKFHRHLVRFTISNRILKKKFEENKKKIIFWRNSSRRVGIASIVFECYVRKEKEKFERKDRGMGKWVSSQAVSGSFRAFRLWLVVEDKSYKLKIPKKVLIYQPGKSPVEHAFLGG